MHYNSMVMRFHTNSLLRTWRFIYLEREHYSAVSPRDVSHPGRDLLTVKLPKCRQDDIGKAGRYS